MAVNTDILILGPFREVVTRAKEAAANAEHGAGQVSHDADPELCKLMIKTSQTLLKEGERALKRIQPLWDSQIERYGDAFARGLSQNDAVEEKRRKLEDVLYDFDDYTEPVTFEAERYAVLQTATRGLALSVIDFIKKTRVETATQGPRFPPLPPLPAVPSLSRSSSNLSLLSSNHTSLATTISGGGAGGRRTITTKRLDRNASIQSSPPSSASPAVPVEADCLLPSTDSLEPASLNKMPTRAMRPHPAKRSLDHMNNHSAHSRRSIVSNTTSRSRTSQTSVDSCPPPAYTASGELLSSLRTPPEGYIPRPSPSKASCSIEISDAATDLPSPMSKFSHNRIQQSHSLTTSIAANLETGPAPSNYTMFPIPRSSTSSSQGSSRTRINAWVSDQAEASSGLSAHLQNARLEQQQPPSVAEALQSLTIPEGKAVNTVRAQKHSSINFDSVLTPMLAQLGNFHINPSTASIPSVDTHDSSPDRTKPSPCSQRGSIFSIRGQEAPVETPGDTIPTRKSQSASESALVPSSLPAAISKPQQPPAELHKNLSVPILPTRPSIPREEWQVETRTIISDHGSTSAGFSIYSETSHPSTAFPQPREPDTAIGPRSSLYALAGFCVGAARFKASGHLEGVRKVAGHVAGISTATARCSSCSYGHAFTELNLDINQKSPRATFPRPDGVLFRIRLLYKSHLVAQRPSEAFYGCVFCAQSGTVVYEGDATVFRSSDDLFRHLARHPHPLPEVPGVTVLYGKDILTTNPSVNDFDLWFGEEPKPLPEVPFAIDLAKLPVALATKNHVQRYAEKKLARPEGKSTDQLLQFFVGARIIGVEFPAAFAGKWCTGFHDGEWGYFPSKFVELEKPRPGRLDAPPMQFQGGGGGSNVTVATRFKWDASAAGTGEKGWLSFDRGEKITNVGWPVLWEGVGGGREAWCWSGTNTKGRFGVFPRSHVDEATLRDDARPFTAAGAPGFGTGWRKEGSGAGKAKSLFRIKRRDSLEYSRDGRSGGVVEIIP